VTDESERTHKVVDFIFFSLYPTIFAYRILAPRIHDSNFGRTTSNPDCDFRGFPQSLQTNSEVIKLLVNHHITFTFYVFSVHDRFCIVFKVSRLQATAESASLNVLIRSIPSFGMWRYVHLVRTDVSKERIASIFRVEKSASEEPS
jgi:hypothetical protein